MSGLGLVVLMHQNVSGAREQIIDILLLKLMGNLYLNVQDVHKLRNDLVRIEIHWILNFLPLWLTLIFFSLSCSICSLFLLFYLLTIRSSPSPTLNKLHGRPNSQAYIGFSSPSSAWDRSRNSYRENIDG